MSLRTIEQAAEATIEAVMDGDPDVGYLWRPDHQLPERVRWQMRMGMARVPEPRRWRYYPGPDGTHYCWATQPLDQEWYGPERWACWQERTVHETDEYVETERTEWRFADLRREAAEQALAWYLAACSDAGVEPKWS